MHYLKLYHCYHYCCLFCYANILVVIIVITCVFIPMIISNPHHFYYYQWLSIVVIVINESHYDCHVDVMSVTPLIRTHLLNFLNSNSLNSNFNYQHCHYYHYPCCWFTNSFSNSTQIIVGLCCSATVNGFTSRFVCD